jgi:hypothetical protein
MKGAISTDNLGIACDVVQLQVVPLHLPNLFVWMGEVHMPNQHIFKLQLGRYNLSVDGKSGQIEVVEIADNVGYFHGTINQP